MRKVIGKFVVTAHTPHESGSTSIVLAPVADPAIPLGEQYAFAQEDELGQTPQGAIEILVGNPSALLMFPVGRLKLVEFVDVED
jgi:hypothetical protein